MKKMMMIVMQLLGYFLIAAEPDIYLSFDCDLTNEKPFQVLNGTESAFLRPVLPDGCTDATKFLRPGLSGNALHAGNRLDKTGFDVIHYHRNEGLLSYEQGSFSLWMKPEDWDGYNRKSHVFLRFRSGPQESFVVAAQNTQGYFRLRMLCGVLTDGTQSIVAEAVRKDWQAGEWHHLGGSWGNGTFSLYLDGEFAAARDYTPSKSNFRQMSIGEQWEANPGSTLIDELRIFRRKLSDAEMNEEYLRLEDKANNGKRSFAVSFPESSPKVDGVIEAGEYAAGFALMNEAVHKQIGYYAEYQPQCYLAADKANLYFAMISSGNLKSTIKEHDGNVWEDDCIEFLLSHSGTHADIFHFIINANGFVYDSQVQAGREMNQWNAQGIQLQNRIVEGKWVMEAAIPWNNFAFTPQAGESFYFNLCRSFRGDLQADFMNEMARKKELIRNCSVSVSNGAFVDARLFGKATIRPDVPAFELLPLGMLSKGDIYAELRLYPKNSDEVTMYLSTGSEKTDFHFQKSLPLIPGKSEVLIAQGKCAVNGTLKLSLGARNAGEFLRATLGYQKPTMLKYVSFQTDRKKMLLQFTMEGGEDSGELYAVRIRMKDWKTEEFVYEQKQDFILRRGLIHLFFDVKQLPAGLFDFHYDFLNAEGKVLHSDYLRYAKPEGKAPWEGTTAGLGDIVPPPWIPIAAENRDFACWGRSIRLGGGGLVSSIQSQQKELLSRPVTLLLDGNPLQFTSKLVNKGKSFADYQLSYAGEVPVTVDLHAEFDGLLWFTVHAGKDGGTIRSLTLEIPLSRKWATAFDDCSSIYEKQDISSWTTNRVFNDPTIKPFFWSGNADVGVMGGAESCRGWYLKDKKHGYLLDVTPEEAIIKMNFIDTPLTLKQSRKIEFYLHPTPTKSKSLEAEKLDALLWRITWHPSRFFEWKVEGEVNEGYMRQFLTMEKTIHNRWFHYFGTKGSSPRFPWWGWYGCDWNMRGDPAWFQQESPMTKREELDRGIWTWTCMNSRSFFDHKLDQIQWYLNTERYQVRDLYFDLAWPTGCQNTEHGCKWVDEFGYTHTDYDLRALHDFHKRVYIMMKEKTPSALMMGHIRFDRTPAEVFFHILTVGESYEQQVTQQSNYFELFKPEVLRILYGYRLNEATIQLGPQIYRTIQVYRRNELKNFRSEDPKIDLAQRHYLAYVKCHHFHHQVYHRTEETQLIHFAQVLRDFGEVSRFYAYWEPDCGVQALKPHPRFLYSVYTGKDRVLVIALNDTDMPIQNTLVFDHAKLKFPATEGTDVFLGQKYQLENNRIFFDLPPRESRFVLFEGGK